MVDSRLRGSDIVVRTINYPKAKRSGKLLGASKEKADPNGPLFCFPRAALWLLAPGFSKFRSKGSYFNAKIKIMKIKPIHITVFIKVSVAGLAYD